MVSMSFFARLSLKFLGNSTFPWMMLSQISQGFSVLPPKGSSPTMNSNSITPKDHRSTSSLYSLPRMISGAMQWGVPMTVLVLWCWLMILAEPKEMSLMQPRSSTIKLSGFRSRTTISSLMKYSRSRINDAAQNCVSAVLNSPISRMESQRLSPQASSVIFMTTLSSSYMVQNWGRKGWVATSVTAISCRTTSIRLCLSTSALRQSFPSRRLFWWRSVSTRLSDPGLSMSEMTVSSRISSSACLARFKSDFSITEMFSFCICSRLLRLSSMRTLSVSTMMSSYSILFNDSVRKASPQVCPASARQLALRSFLSLPSMTTISFSTVFPLLKMQRPALLYYTRNPSKKVSQSRLRRLNRTRFFCTTCFTQFLNMTSRKSAPMILASVSRPSTWHTTSSSARTVIFRIVLQQSEFCPKLQPLQILRYSRLPCSREAVPSLMMQNDDPGSPSSTMFCPLQYLRVTKEEATFSFCCGFRNWQKAMPSRNFWLDSNSLITISSTASRKLTLSITQKEVGSLVMAVEGRSISYSKANSPKPSPTRSYLVSSSSTLICTEPLWIIQKQEPTVPCLKTSALGGIQARNMLSFTLSSSFSERLQKMKWFLRQLRMKVLSVSFLGNYSGSMPYYRTRARISLRRICYSCRSFLLDSSIMCDYGILQPHQKS